MDASNSPHVESLNRTHFQLARQGSVEVSRKKPLKWSLDLDMTRNCFARPFSIKLMARLQMNRTIKVSKNNCKTMKKSFGYVYYVHILNMPIKFGLTRHKSMATHLYNLSYSYILTQSEQAGFKCKNCVNIAVHLQL